MKHALLFFGVSIAFAQGPELGNARQRAEDDMYPRGRKQAEEILKAEYVKNVADSIELARLSAELRDELDKTDPHVLSISLVKKSEEIEKLAHRIRGRIRR